MLREVAVVLVIAFVIFEIIEHIVFPLVWSYLQRRKVSPCDVSSLVGRSCKVRQWHDLEGKIFIKGEIWNARSDSPLTQGDKAVIEKVEGLMLRVKKQSNVM